MALGYKTISNQGKEEFFKTDTGLELAQAYWEDEEKMIDRKFAKIEAKGDKIRSEKREAIEERRREVKENLAKVKREKERKNYSYTSTESSE